MGKKADLLKKSDSRGQLERAALMLCDAAVPKHRRIESLATLLSAFALGSRTATRGLEEYQRRYPGWKMPDREKAMTMANEAFQEAEALQEGYKDGDTLPGF